MGVAELVECLGRKQLVHHFRFLQAERVRRMFSQEATDQPDAQPDRIDIPGGKLHCFDIPSMLQLHSSTFKLKYLFQNNTLDENYEC